MAQSLDVTVLQTDYMVNKLADFPADRFAIKALCACGHTATIDTSTLPADLTVPALRRSLRCGRCGRRATGIRILWTAAGGFRYSAA